MGIDAFQDLAFRAEFPPPAIWTEILRSQTLLLNETPDGVSFYAIGYDAWSRLNEEQRNEAFGLMLNSYATSICVSHNEREHEEELVEAAADPTMSYCDVGDLGALWDAVQGSDASVQFVEVERRSLMNVLSEIELLQHRIKMRDQQPS